MKMNTCRKLYGVIIIFITCFIGQMAQPSQSAYANEAPVVKAGPDRFITLPQNAVTLLGAVRDDNLPFGILNSSWTQLSGTGTVTFANSLSPETTAYFSAAGAYVLQLSASDGSLFATDTVSVTVNASSQPVNLAPVVKAGPDRFITLPQNAVTLLGAVRDDNLPFGILNSSWTQLRGAGTVTFANSLSPETTAYFSAAGTYVLQLSASDGALFATDTVTVTVVSASQNSPLDNENVIQPGTRTLVRSSDNNSADAKIVFHTDEPGRVTFFVYERSMGMKSMEFDVIQGNNEIRIRDIQNQLNLSWGIYHITIRQNGKVLKKNFPLALIP
jgi:archaellum component FlaF (FlaF/FlaG flagellin family)